MPRAQAGDEQVTKFVGSPYIEGTSVEAELDIQFIMGVADGMVQLEWTKTPIDTGRLQEWPPNSGAWKDKTSAQT